MANNLNSLLDNFGVATVMDIKMVRWESGHNWYKLTEGDFPDKSKSEKLFLDTLKLSNIKESTPEKTFKVGAANVPIARVGKKVTVEIQDALGKIDALTTFFGLEKDTATGRLYSTERFSGPLCLEGEMYILNDKGDFESVYVFMPCCVPDSALEITGNNDEFGTFNLNVQLFPVLFTDKNNNTRKIFYAISDESILGD